MNEKKNNITNSTNKFSSSRGSECVLNLSYVFFPPSCQTHTLYNRGSTACRSRRSFLRQRVKGTVVMYYTVSDIWEALMFFFFHSTDHVHERHVCVCACLLCYREGNAAAVSKILCKNLYTSPPRRQIYRVESL